MYAAEQKCKLKT